MWFLYNYVYLQEEIIINRKPYKANANQKGI